MFEAAHQETEKHHPFMPQTNKSEIYDTETSFYKGIYRASIRHL